MCAATIQSSPVSTYIGRLGFGYDGPRREDTLQGIIHKIADEVADHYIAKCKSPFPINKANKGLLISQILDKIEHSAKEWLASVPDQGLEWVLKTSISLLPPKDKTVEQHLGRSAEVYLGPVTNKSQRSEKEQLFKSLEKIIPATNKLQSVVQKDLDQQPFYTLNEGSVSSNPVPESGKDYGWELDDASRKEIDWSKPTASVEQSNLGDDFVVLDAVSLS